MERASEEEFLQAAFKLLADATEGSVLVADRGGRLRFANRRARALLGWEGREELDPLSLDSIPIATSLRTRARRDPGPWELETTVEARGRTVPVRVSVQPIARRGSVVGSLILITEPPEVSTLVAERDRARQNDRAKTRSLHMVAHDLSGPLTILNGYVSLVVEGGRVRGPR